MTRPYLFRFHRALRAVVALFCFTGIGAPAWAQFETRATNSLPFGAFSVATGDFNRDGKLDIAVTVDGGFAVALGNGDGTFQKSVFYSTQLSYALAVADFNGDGKLDIVVANLGPSAVDVFLGNGDGTFQTPISSNTTKGSYVVAVGDFNNDKILDLVVIDPPYVSVLLGNGDGTFQPPSDNNSFVGPQKLAVGDFNNDHKLDVVVVGFFGGSQDIGVLLGNGDGTLQSSLTYPLTYTPATVATGDFNHDGNLDAVIADEFSGVTVLLGNGDGSFQPAVTYNTTGTSGGPLVVNDLKLNGKLDLAIEGAAGRLGGVDVFWGNGDGTFQPAQFFASGESGLPAVGDLNGDGLPDFVLANDVYGAITMLNTGVVSFSPTAPVVFPVQLIKTTSAPETVTVTNHGTTALTVSSIQVSGEFQIGNTCGSSVAAGASCTISSEFKPKTAGHHAGLITLVDSASSKPQFIELSGRATAVKLSRISVNFGSQKVGTKSAPQAVTATNEGSTAITFSSINVGGKNGKDFSQTNDCLSGQILPGGSCSVNVTFAPTKTGARAGTLFIDVQGGNSPQVVALTGTGT